MECSQEKTKLLNYTVESVRDAKQAKEKLGEERKLNLELAERLEFVRIQEVDLRQHVRGND